MKCYDCDTELLEKWNYCPNCKRKLRKNKIVEDSLVSREIDLTSSTGQKTYGSFTDNIGLLTEAEYKKFESVIKNYPVDDWWWLATADTRWINTILCVDNIGALDCDSCYGNYGVRPACVFKAEVFEKE